ncbi:alpha-(1-_3)-arabinofuranosyltransferase domain-containing protein, partial [Nocardia salmonicida]|uniref:alpha-(1->3)-arabinofuranosyltransferase domain-containing protein n=1 Tax=Nocardia salmonicida TaxID=53431 RepID=UPI0033F97EB8
MVLGQPFLDNNVRTPGWDQVPDAWVEARDYLAEHQADTTTLVVPGSGFARQDWGWTNDEPLLALGGVRWVTRSQVPLIPGQSIRFLSALDRLVTTGRATDGLSEQLARAGIGHVVVRRDLERGRTDSPHPGVSTVSLDQPGLTPVADFGGARDGGPRVEIYAVGASSTRVRSTAADDVVTVSGAPESVLDVQDEGLARSGRATVLAGERGWDAIPDVVTDGNQRRERAFGSVHESLSAVMEADEDYRTPRGVHDYPAVPGAPQVVARYDDVLGIRASSSQGYADTFGGVTPQNAPYAAFDGDRATRWVSSPAGKPEEQWLRIEFDGPRRLDEVTVTPVVGDAAMVPVRRFVLVAGGVERSVSVNPTGSPLVVDFRGHQAHSLEIRVDEVGSTGGRGSVAIRDVTIGRATPTRSFVLPDEVGPDSGLVLESDSRGRLPGSTGRAAGWHGP